MADKKIDLKVLGQVYPLEVLEAIQEFFAKECPGMEIEFSRHLLTRKPEAGVSAAADVCSRCHEPMTGENRERIAAQDICSDGKFYCVDCLVDDQCGCLPVGS